MVCFPPNFQRNQVAVHIDLRKHTECVTMRASMPEASEAAVPEHSLGPAATATPATAVTEALATLEPQPRQVTDIMRSIPWLHCLRLVLQGTELLWLLVLCFPVECLVEIDCDQMA